MFVILLQSASVSTEFFDISIFPPNLNLAVKFEIILITGSCSKKYQLFQKLLWSHCNNFQNFLFQIFYVFVSKYSKSNIILLVHCLKIQNINVHWDGHVHSFVHEFYLNIERVHLFTQNGMNVFIALFILMNVKTRSLRPYASDNISYHRTKFWFVLDSFPQTLPALQNRSFPWF